MITILASLLALQPAQWPLCEDVDLELGRGADCVLATTDTASWFVAFDYKPDEEADSLTVIVTAADGIPVQTIDLSFDFAGGAGRPYTRDVDGDGFEDIVISNSPPGVVNGDYSILFGDFDGFWSPSTKPNGHSLISVEPGLFFTMARASSAERAVVFYTRERATLIEQAVVAFGLNIEGEPFCRLERAIDDRGEEFYCNVAQTY